MLGWAGSIVALWLAGDPTASSPAMQPQSAGSNRIDVGIKLGIVPGGDDNATNVGGLSLGLLGDRAARVTGLQLALFYTRVNDGLDGVQAGLGFNFVDGVFRGAQLAGAANFAKDGAGVQLAIGFNVAGRLRGAQVALGNDVEDGRGVQLGLFNKAVAFDGAQIGLSNFGDQSRGVQVGLVNGAEEVAGVQLGAVNLARRAQGFRLGLLNVSKRSGGFDLAVVNVMGESDGEAFALVNLIGGGIHQLAAYSTDIMLGNVALKLGGRHLYSALIVAYQPGRALTSQMDNLGRDNRRAGFGLGAGWRVPLARKRLEAVEIETSSVTVGSRFAAEWTDRPFVSSLRATLVIRLLSGVALLAGAGLNVALAAGGRDIDIGLGLAEAVGRSGDLTVRVFPGAVLGLQI